MRPQPDFSLSNILRKSLIGFTLRCPNCEKGRTFKGHLFKLEEKCAYCDVRFERSQGESIGGVFIALTVAEIISVGGFFLFEALFDPSTEFQLIFWGVFLVTFILLMYRHMRGLWIGINYLTGGVYRDEERENPDAIVHPPPQDRLNG